LIKALSAIVGFVVAIYVMYSYRQFDLKFTSIMVLLFYFAFQVPFMFWIRSKLPQRRLLYPIFFPFTGVIPWVLFIFIFSYSHSLESMVSVPGLMLLSIFCIAGLVTGIMLAILDRDKQI
jgi:hypothetical protein